MLFNSLFTKLAKGFACHPEFFPTLQGNVIRVSIKSNSYSINAPQFIKRSAAINTKKNSPEAEMESLKKTDDKIIWVDCEMTGLDINCDQVMEIACIITDGNLKEIARHPQIIIKVSDDLLTGMNEWCTKHHGESGLTEACKTSDVSLEKADEMLHSFAQRHTFPGVCPLAGNSIHMDRVFISHQLPKFHKHLHYRNIDVSTIKELTMRWFPDDYKNAPQKKFTHRVISDIEESIAELNYYRSAVFREHNAKEL